MLANSRSGNHEPEQHDDWPLYRSGVENKLSSLSSPSVRPLSPSSDIKFQPVMASIEHVALDDHRIGVTFSEIHFKPQTFIGGIKVGHRRQGSLTDIQFQPKTAIAENDGNGSQGSYSEIQVTPMNENGGHQMHTSPSTLARSNISEILVPPLQPALSSHFLTPPSVSEAKEIDLSGIFHNGEMGTPSPVKCSSPSQNGTSIGDEREDDIDTSDHSSTEIPSLQMFFARQNGRVGTRSNFPNANSRLGHSLHSSRRVGLSTRSIRSGKSFVSQRSSMSGSNSSRGESHGSLSFYYASSKLDVTSEEGEPTYLAPAPDSDVASQCELGITQSADDHDVQEIEVGPGFFLRLRGARETWTAMLQEKCVRAFCPFCGIDMLFIFDAEFVLCPVCRDIFPSDVGVEGGGVGLGVNIDELNPRLNM